MELERGLAAQLEDLSLRLRAGGFCVESMRTARPTLTLM